MNKTISLPMFTWALVQSEQGNEIVSPVCAEHPDSAPIGGTTEDGEMFFFECRITHTQIRFPCTKADFYAEQAEAERALR